MKKVELIAVVCEDGFCERCGQPGQYIVDGDGYRLLLEPFYGAWLCADCESRKAAKRNGWRELDRVAYRDLESPFCRLACWYGIIAPYQNDPGNREHDNCPALTPEVEHALYLLRV